MARTKKQEEAFNVLLSGQIPGSSPLYTAAPVQIDPFAEAIAATQSTVDSKSKSSIPELEPMAELPMPEGEQARQARRRSLLKQKRRRGRESTILSSPVSLLSEEIGV